MTELKSFLGLINYYHRYLQNFLFFLKPLHCLLIKETPWKWTEKENNSLNKVKELLSLAKLLVNHDNNKPLILVCNVSPYRLGAVLFHIMEDDSERPIAFTPRSLSKAEPNYSQMEKEGLAIILGLKNSIHIYLCTIILNYY